MTYRIVATRIGNNKEKLYQTVSNENDAKKLLDEHWSNQKKLGNSPTEIQNNSFSCKGIKVGFGTSEVYTDFYSIRNTNT